MSWANNVLPRFIGVSGENKAKRLPHRQFVVQIGDTTKTSECRSSSWFQAHGYRFNQTLLTLAILRKRPHAEAGSRQQVALKLPFFQFAFRLFMTHRILLKATRVAMPSALFGLVGQVWADANEPNSYAVARILASNDKAQIESLLKSEAVIHPADEQGWMLRSIDGRIGALSADILRSWMSSDAFRALPPSRRDGLILQLAFPSNAVVARIEKGAPDDDFYALVRKDVAERAALAKLVLNSDAAYAKKIGPRLLLAAAGQANVPMIDMLLAAGIKPVENAIGLALMSRAAQKDQYRTALASADDQWDVIKKLLAAKANVNATTRGVSTLYLAMTSVFTTQSCEIDTRQPLPLDSGGGLGGTPRSRSERCAVGSEHFGEKKMALDILERLLKQGATLQDDFPSYVGRPADWAKANGLEEAIPLLQKYKIPL